MANDKVNLHQLKAMPPHELLAYAEKVGVDNPSALKKQNMLFAILKYFLHILIELLSSIPISANVIFLLISVENKRL